MSFYPYFLWFMPNDCQIYVWPWTGRPLHIVTLLCRTFYFRSTRGFARHWRLVKGSPFFWYKRTRFRRISKLNARIPWLTNIMSQKAACLVLVIGLACLLFAHASGSEGKLNRIWALFITDKRTDVWSRPSCIYTQIFTPKKNWFFPHKKYFPIFWLLFTFILCNFSVRTLKYFQKYFQLIFCP